MFVTRIAPSPTGMFHLGTARTALFNYLAAKASNGKFILRIDDTDTDRNKQEYTDIILETLDWLGLKYDELYYQSKRTDLYLETARRLVEAGKAFSPTGVAAILLKPPVALPNSFLDTVAGEIQITDTNRKQIEGGTIGDKTSNGTVLIRENGMATYQFASVVDDYYLGINYIIRGVDHITNTPKQIAIWVAIHDSAGIPWSKLSEEEGIEYLPQFAHIGLIHKDKKKLSKRDNAASLLWYRDNCLAEPNSSADKVRHSGYSPEAILNFILRMGWGCKEDTNKALSLQEMIEMFLKGRMRAAPSNFDENKLKYYQKVCK
jgi:glutamyl/glutaminyl-tRNA synthetase